MEKIASNKVSLINWLIYSFHGGTPFLPHTVEEKKIEEFVEALVHEVYFSFKEENGPD